jgi:hypothetical protein
LDPIQIELPVRASEAAALAEVVFHVTEGRRLTDDLRNRAAGRIESLGLETIVPFLGSLQADPIHPNCFFLAIDAVRGGAPKPYLLRLANANAPSSGLFQKSILIGRMRPGGGREIVINAAPFSASTNQEAILTFVREVDRMFLPRPSGAAFTVFADGAFGDFRSLLQESGLNAAAVNAEWHEGVLRAIRAGWREGYSIAAPALVLTADTDAVSAALEVVGYTKAVFDVARLPVEARAAIVGEAYDAVVRANASRQWTWKRPDLEVCWDSAASGEPTPATEIAGLLANLREAGRAVQSAAPVLGDDWRDAVEVVRASGAALRVSSSQPGLQDVARACGGRVHCVAAPGEDVRALVKLLRS